MKIGIFLPNATFDLPGTPEVGGIETFAFTVGEELLRQGHDVILYGGKPKIGRKHRETAIPLKLYDYIETKSIPDIGTRFQRLVQRLHFGWVTRKDWLAENFDLALVFKPFDWPVAWFWKKKNARIKVLMSFQGEDFYFLDSVFYSAIHKSFSVSSHIASVAFARTGRKSWVIPNPVNTSLFCPPLNEAEKFLETTQIVSAGRLIGWKGFKQLVRALKIIRERGLQFNAVIAGDGPARGEIEAMISTLGLESHVQLAGTLSPRQLVSLYHQSDIFVAPSIGFESFSIATLEAASSGLPLILSDQIGIKEFFGQGDCSIYPAMDEESLAECLMSRISLCPKTTHAEKISRYQKIKAIFDVETITHQILQLADSKN
ncbi:glycosyltransferase family 4 protein [Kamptonema cortianum]|nr:glycosyltransferase family 4 protein [Kamptonema cortianum]MDL5053869.1 glycosyltransferase family 4 protein [Oscillatoria laete-virens NRMC-F 0139]